MWAHSVIPSYQLQESIIERRIRGIAHVHFIIVQIM